ncbi:40412_t:CDS:2 [Gigaspora margarita]|uniref:40412_t:CDS:1 n=1 Tax=Gigaspora margarita TaxID=4874 RepID=A0ABN7UVV2_GIGMA|nr:40412_t:CDS:2 [Gigaspora margarita]
MEIFSEKEFEFNIEQENKEDSKETIIHFTSNLAVNANNMYYSTVLVEYPSTSSQNSKEPSAFLHLDEHNQPYEAQLENILCEVKFYRFIPIDLIKCSFVILVCIEEHTHPPPLPSHVPEAIQNQLKSLIETTSRDLEHVTPRKLISDTNF